MALRIETTAWDREMRSEAIVTRTMFAKYQGTCTSCRQQFPAGTEIVYSRETRTARHYRCSIKAQRPTYSTYRTTAIVGGCDGCVRTIYGGSTMTKVVRADGARFDYCKHCQTPRDSAVEDQIADAADVLLDEYDAAA